jgi:hypothetical protein
MPRTIAGAANALHNRRTMHILGAEINSVIDSRGTTDELLIGEHRAIPTEEDTQSVA